MVHLRGLHLQYSFITEDSTGLCLTDLIVDIGAEREFVHIQATKACKERIALHKRFINRHDNGDPSSPASGYVQTALRWHASCRTRRISPLPPRARSAISSEFASVRSEAGVVFLGG